MNCPGYCQTEKLEEGLNGCTLKRAESDREDNGEPCQLHSSGRVFLSLLELLRRLYSSCNETEICMKIHINIQKRLLRNCVVLNENIPF